MPCRGCDKNSICFVIMEISWTDFSTTVHAAASQTQYNNNKKNNESYRIRSRGNPKCKWIKTLKTELGLLGPEVTSDHEICVIAELVVCMCVLGGGCVIVCVYVSNNSHVKTHMVFRLNLHELTHWTFIFHPWGHIIINYYLDLLHSGFVINHFTLITWIKVIC